MSYEVDTKVMEVQFHNKEFEAAVGQTLKTLNKLNESFQFDGAVDSFKEIEKAAKRLDFTVLEDNVNRLTNAFSSLGGRIKRAFIDDFATSMESQAKSIAKSMLGITQIQNAWESYATRTTAVQTIMNATSKEFSDTAQQMAYVNAQLDKLTWFTDETSYQFDAMVSSIGKFTAAGIDLESAVDNMQGIATWAAISGVNAQNASHAMNELAQAMGSGYIRSKDWMSIQTMNMATEEFKQTAIDTAVAMGTLVMGADGYARTMRGNIVTTANFQATLSDLWFTAKVANKSFSKYGEYASRMYEFMQATDDAYDTTAELMRIVEEYGKTAGNAAEREKLLTREMERTGLSNEELVDWFELLNDDIYELGRRSFRAAQEAKTFGEAIDSVRTAVASGWTNTFQIIFGDYEEARKLWTNFADWLWGVFNGGAGRRNAIAQFWKDFGGREALFGGEDTVGLLQALVHAFDALIEPARNAWNSIFPKKTAEELGRSLAIVTMRIRNLFENLRLSPKAAAGLERILTVLIKPLKLVATFAEYAWKTLVVLIYYSGKAVDWLFSLAGGTETAGRSFERFSSHGKVMASILAVLGSVAALPVIAFQKLTSGINWLISACKESPAVRELAAALRGLGEALWSKAVTLWEKARKELTKFYHIIKPFLPTAEDLQNALHNLGMVFMNLPKTIAKAVNSLTEFIKSGNKLDKIKTSILNLAPTFKNFGDNIVSGLSTGIKAGLSGVIKLAYGLFNGFKLAFMDAAGIHSPSVVMQALGAFITWGLVLGMAGYMAKLHEMGFSLFDAILKGLKDAGYTSEDQVVQVVEYLAKGFTYLQQVLEPVNNFMVRFFDNLSAGHIILLAFSVSLLKAMQHLNKISDAVALQIEGIGKATSGLITAVGAPFTALGKGLTSTFESLSGGITKFFDSISARESSKNMLRNAAAIGIITASIIAMYYTFQTVNWEAFAVAVLTFSGMVGVLTASVWAINKMGVAIAAAGGFDAMARAVGKLALVAISMSVAIGIIAGVATASPWGVVGAIGALTALMLEFVLACIALNKWVPDGLKSTIGFIGLAWALVTMAKAFKIIAESVKDNEYWAQAIYAYLAVISVAAMAIGALDGVKPGSGVAFLSVIASMLLAVKLLDELWQRVYGLDLEAPWIVLAKTMPYIIELGVIATMAAAVLRIAGNGLKGAGFGLAAGVGALYLAWALFDNLKSDIEDSKFIEWFSEVYPQLFKMVMWIGVLDAIISLLRGMELNIPGLSAKFGKGGGIFRGFVGFGVGMIAAVGALKLMEKLDLDKIHANIESLGAVMLAMGVTLAIAGLGKNVASNIQKMTAAIIAMTVCIAFLSLFVQEGKEGAIMGPALALAAGLVGFGITLWGASQITNKVKLGPFFVMMLAVLEIAAAIYSLAQYDWKALLSAAGGLALCMTAMSIALRILGKAQAPKFGAVLASFAMLAEATAALYVLSLNPWDDIIKAGAALGIVVVALSVALSQLSAYEGSMLTGAAALDLAAISLGISAGALLILAQKPWDDIIKGALALAICVNALSLALFIPSKLGSNIILGALGLVVASVSLLPAAAALSMLAQYDWESIKQATSSLLIAVGVVAAIAAVIGATGGFVPVTLGAIAIALLGAALAAFVAPVSIFVSSVERLAPAINDLSTSLYSLAAFDPETIQNAGATIAAIGETMVDETVKMRTKVAAEMFSVGVYARASLVMGMSDDKNTVYWAAENMGENAERGVRDATQVYSPSKLFIGIGKYIVGSFISGFADDVAQKAVFGSAEEMGAQAPAGVTTDQNLDAAEGAGRTLGQKILDGLKSVLNGIKGMFNKLGANFDLSGAGEKVKEFVKEPAKTVQEVISSIPETLNNLYDNATGGSLDILGPNGPLSQALDGVLGDLGDLGGSLSDLGDIGAGSAGSVGSLANETENLADVTTYAADAVIYLNKRYEEQDKSLGGLTNSLAGYFEAQDKVLQATNKTGEATDKLASALGNKTPYERAIEATEQLVLSHLKYVSSVDDSIQGVQKFGDMTVDQLERAKAEWESFAGHLQKAFGDGDMWGSPIPVGEEWNAADYDISKYIDNLEESVNDRKILSNLLEQLYTLGLDPAIIEEIMDKGTGEAIKIAYGITQGSAAQIAQLNKLYAENAAQKTDMPYDFLMKSGFELKPEDIQQLGLSLAGSIQNAVHSKQFAEGLYTAGADMYMMLMSIDNKDDLFAKMYEMGLGDYFGSYIQQHGKTDAEDYGEMIYDIITMWTSDTLANWETQIKDLYAELQGMQIVGVQADNAERDFARGLWPSYQEALAQYQSALADWKAGGQAGVMPKLADYYSSVGRMNGNLSARQANAAVNSNDAARAQSHTTNVGGTVINNNNTINQKFESKNDGATDAYVGTNSALAKLDRRDPHYMAEMSKAFND